MLARLIYETPILTQARTEGHLLVIYGREAERVSNVLFQRGFKTVFLKGSKPFILLYWSLVSFQTLLYSRSSTHVFWNLLLILWSWKKTLKKRRTAFSEVVFGGAHRLLVSNLSIGAREPRSQKKLTDRRASPENRGYNLMMLYLPPSDLYSIWSEITLLMNVSVL